MLRDPTDTARGIGSALSIQAASTLAWDGCDPIDVRDATEIERTVAAFARFSNGGLVVTRSGLAVVHRDLIITLAATASSARGLPLARVCHRAVA